MRRSKLLLGAVAAGVVCASGAAHAAHVGVYIGGPAYYEPAPVPYYYQPAPPPPPQYIERGPDGQPVPAPGPDGATQYPQDGAAPYPPGSEPQYPQGSAPQYPQGSAPQYPPDDSAQYAPGAQPQYPQGSAPQYPPGAAVPAPQGSAPQAASPQPGSGNTWYYCDATNTYYPYVKDCSSGWRPVPAQQQTQPQ